MLKDRRTHTGRETHTFSISIPKMIRETGWQLAQNQSNPLSRYTAYLNRICLDTLLPFFHEWTEEEGLEKPLKWPREEQLFQSLEFVSGTALQIGEIRIVLIPYEIEECREFVVPQEWVDCPAYCGDYYLAVAVNLDLEEQENWLKIEGFTTHQQLKTVGHHRESDRTYTMEFNALVRDLNLIDLTDNLKVREPLPDLPQIEPGEVEQLLNMLGDAALYSPRLRTDISTDKWLSLINHCSYQKKLYARKMGEDLTEKNNSTEPITLKKWLGAIAEETQKILKEGWQSFDSLFEPLEPSPVRGHLSIDRHLTEPIDSKSEAAISPIISLLEPYQKKNLRYHAAGVLGEIGRGHPEAIAALSDLLKIEKDEEMRWQAALSLGKIDPGNPISGTKKAKLIDLGLRLHAREIALIIAIIPKNEERLGVFVQVRSVNEELPTGLKLSILSETGEVIPKLEVEARSDTAGEGKDNSIQLRFTPPSGTIFQVRVTSNDREFTETFIA